METGPTEPAGVSAGEMVACPVCREPIRAGARRCVKCTSDLGWRRYLGFSNTTLALLTALVSVCATSYPALHRAFTPARAPLAIHYLGLNPGNLSLSLLVTNRGREVGALRQTILSARWAGRPDLLIFPELAKGGAIFVSGESSVGVDLDLHRVEAFTRNGDAPAVDVTDAVRARPGDVLAPGASCGISFFAVDSGGVETRTFVPVECAGLSALLGRAARDAAAGGGKREAE
jgi:hypothetical protein